MLPVFINLQIIDVALVGEGERLINRLRLLLGQGAKNLSVYTPNVTPIFKEFEDKISLYEYLPKIEQLKLHKLIMIVGLEKDISEDLAKLARNHNIIVNVEDNKEFCDFYFATFIKRGDLIVAVGSGGKSPSVAKRIRQYIDKLLHPDWGARLDLIDNERDKWKKQNLSMCELISRSEEFIDKQDWKL